MTKPTHPPEVDTVEVVEQETPAEVVDALAEAVGAPAGSVRAAVESALADLFSGSSPAKRGVVEPDRLEVVVAPKNLGRVTGWVVVCPECGAMKVAAPSQSAAVTAAATHLEVEHPARLARIVKRSLGRRGRGRAA